MRRSTPLRSAVAAIVAARRPRPDTARLRRHLRAALFLRPKPALSRPPLRSAPPRVMASGDRQAAFAAAAEPTTCRESVLLAVSYLESRWDAHAGAAQHHRRLRPDAPHRRPTALAEAPHHSEGTEDPRGDDARAGPAPRHRGGRRRPNSRPAAARCEGGRADRPDAPSSSAPTRPPTSPAARHCWPTTSRTWREPLSADPADWYGAVARYSGRRRHRDGGGLRRRGVRRDPRRRRRARPTTDSWSPSPRARPGARQRPAEAARAAEGRRAATAPSARATVSCEWIPAPYEEFGEGDYGNHDLADRPRQPEDRLHRHPRHRGAYDTTSNLVQDPTYVSAGTTRCAPRDGHIAQHVKTKDVAWHAGNWYVNAKSIGLEHEGFLAAARRLVHRGDVPRVGQAGAVPGAAGTASRWTGAHPRP